MYQMKTQPSGFYGEQKKSSDYPVTKTKKVNANETIIK